MKKWGILLLAGLVGIALVACQNNYLTKDDLSGYVKTATCMACHNSDLSSNDNLVAARAGYDASGHADGPRVFTLSTVATATGEMYVADGSNSKYTDGADCSKCHTNEGFVNWVKSGPATTTSTDFGSIANTSTDGGNTSPPACFTCHNPHTNYTMALRVEKAVNLPSGMSTSASTSTNVFNGGAGNLCANCHQDRTTPAALASAVALSGTNVAVAITARFGTHHGPMSDFMLGVDAFAKDSTSTFAQSPHYPNAAGTSGATDTCVTCHMFTPTTRAGVTQRIVGHGMYLTDSVHGTSTDYVTACQQCHATTTAALAGGASKTSVSTAKTFATIISGSTYLSSADLAKKALLAYFGNSANFYTSAAATTAQTANTGKGAVVDAVTGFDYTPGTTYEWHANWEFQGGTVYAKPLVAKALWNFHLFMEDKSRGAHNPEFAAQLLYDAIDLITQAGGTISQPAAWTTRP